MSETALANKNASPFFCCFVVVVAVIVIVVVVMMVVVIVVVVVKMLMNHHSVPFEEGNVSNFKQSKECVSDGATVGQALMQRSEMR